MQIQTNPTKTSCMMWHIALAQHRISDFHFKRRLAVPPFLGPPWFWPPACWPIRGPLPSKSECGPLGLVSSMRWHSHPWTISYRAWWWRAYLSSSVKSSSDRGSHKGVEWECWCWNCLVCDSSVESHALGLQLPLRRWLGWVWGYKCLLRMWLEP